MSRCQAPGHGFGGEGLLSGGGTLAERYLQGALRAIPLDREADLVSGLPGVDRLTELVASLHWMVVDRSHFVVGFEPCVGGGAAGADLADLCRAVVRETDSEVGMLDAAVLDQLLRDAPSCVTGNRVTDSVAAAGLAPDLGGDADDPALAVQQRAARVAVVERRVGLDRVLDREPVRRLDLAA